jgi:hypothetical protein
MHDEPTRLERKLSKDLKREERHAEVALHKHLKDLERAEKHRLEAEHLREQLAKLRIKELRIAEKIEEHEIKARQLMTSHPDPRERF